jgi:hypothetical protein
MNQDLKEIVSNFMFFLTKMVDYSNYPGKEYSILPEKVHFISGSEDPLLNGICFYYRDETELLRDVQLLSKKMQEYYIWWPHEQLSEPVLSKLKSYNLQNISTFMCLAAELNELKTVPIHPAIDIQLVTSDGSYQLFMDIFMKGFGIPENLYDDYFRMFSFYQKEPEVLYHFIAYYDGQPAAIVSVVKQDQMVGMYTGTTLSRFKNKGILTALYSRIIELMRDSGAVKMVYQSKHPILVENIKARFGFRMASELTAYKMRN